MTDSAHEQAVTSVEDALATGRLEMAGLRVAVLRSESESIHNPAWDPVPVIEEDLGWRVEIFVERDFRALLDVDYEFDCILIGHNALFRRREVADAMSRHRFRAGVVILQQRFIDGGLDLGNGLSLKVQDLARPVSRVTIARGRPADREVLLNWPCPLRDLDSEFRCEALRGFVLPETAPWRVILEGRSNGRLMPVLIRAPPSAATRVVATSLLLERHNDAHVKLLRNIVTLAAAGPPQTVVEAQDSAWRGTVARKLRLRGVAAVAIEPEPEFGNRWRFDSWPYVGVTDVFVEGRDVGDLAKVLEREEVAAWLRRGGRLAVVDELGRTNTFFHGSEVDWVARRFIGQLQVAGPAWRKSILSLRAVLRLMGHLWRLEPEDRLARFGVPTAQELREAARALVDSRLRSGDNVESTLSVTVALLDIDDELGNRVLVPGERDRITAWLKGAYEQRLLLEDQFDVARALRDRSMLEVAMDALPPVLPVTLFTRVCDARAAVGVLAALDRRLTPLAVQEISSSTTVAATFLAAVARSGGTELLAPDRIAYADVAIATIRKRGALSLGGAATDATVEALAAEALAVALVGTLNPVSVGDADRAKELPASVIDDLLREVALLRSRGADDQVTLARQGRALILARRVLTTLAVFLAGGLALVLTSGVETTGDALAALTIFSLAVLAFAGLLAKVGLLPDGVAAALRAARRWWDQTVAARWDDGSDARGDVGKTPA